MSYQPDTSLSTLDRIARLRAVLGDDVDEIAATLVDEDEAAFPGVWASAGFTRSGAISEYLYEMGAS